MSFYEMNVETSKWQWKVKHSRSVVGFNNLTTQIDIIKHYENILWKNDSGDRDLWRIGTSFRRLRYFFLPTWISSYKELQIKRKNTINQNNFISHLIFLCGKKYINSQTSVLVLYIYIARLSNNFPNYLEVLEVNDAAETLPIVPETIEILETSKSDQRNLLHVPRGASDEGHFFQPGGVLLPW